MKTVKDGKLEHLPIVCKFCPSTDVAVIDSWVNLNTGDDFFQAHVHFNILYRCLRCFEDFPVRAYVPLLDLYYGDFHPSGKVCDMSAETQQRLSETGAAPGAEKKDNSMEETRIANRWEAVEGRPYPVAWLDHPGSRMAERARAKAQENKGEGSL
jgi:hypothetical protein